MATRRTTNRLLPGHATHTRTEGDYMAVLLDEVSLDTWRDVVKATVQEAKSGNAQARAWLGQYLIGQPASKAPTAVQVVVNQLQGTNPVLDKLTHKTFIDAKFHDADVTVKGNIRAQLAIELQNKMQQSNAT